MGGSDRWFENYERLLDQRDAGELEGDETDIELAERASELEQDQMADRADQLNDEKWERAYEAKLKEKADEKGL